MVEISPELARSTLLVVLLSLSTEASAFTSSGRSSLSMRRILGPSVRGLLDGGLLCVEGTGEPVHPV